MMNWLMVVLERMTNQVIGWLSPVNPKDTFDIVAKSRVATSGDWITRTGQVRRWIESSKSATFWLNGISTSFTNNGLLYNN